MTSCHNYDVLQNDGFLQEMSAKYLTATADPPAQIDFGPISLFTRPMRAFICVRADDPITGQ